MNSDVCTIAIVDDDVRTCETLKYMVKSSFPKYRVLCAHDGDKGLSMICQDRPNLVILDIDMPQMNGLEVLEEIKSGLDLLNLSVIMLTGNSSEERAEASMYWYADAYLEKPCSRERLTGVINRLLSVRSAAMCGIVDYSAAGSSLCAASACR